MKKRPDIEPAGLLSVVVQGRKVLRSKTSGVRISPGAPTTLISAAYLAGAASVDVPFALANLLFRDGARWGLRAYGRTEHLLRKQELGLSVGERLLTAACVFRNVPPCGSFPHPGARNVGPVRYGWRIPTKLRSRRSSRAGEKAEAETRRARRRAQSIRAQSHVVDKQGRGVWILP